MKKEDSSVGGSFRSKTVPFTQVSNSALKDKTMSLKAKGLYSLIQSHITIPGFTLYKKHLMSLCTEKEKAFDAAWKELQTKGYLKQYRTPSGNRGSFVYEYDLLDVANLTTPAWVILSKNGEPIQGNKSPEATADHPPHLAPHAPSTPCSEHPMLDGGDINNTDLNNIDRSNTEGEKRSTPTQAYDGNDLKKEKEPPEIPKQPSKGLKESSPAIYNQVNYNYNRLDQNSQEPAENVSQSTYGRFSKVKLTAAEYADLLKEFGEKKVLDYIGRLDEHIASTGKMYPSHFATIVKWIDQDDRKLSSNRPIYKNRFINYEQRQWDYDEIEQLAQQEMIQISKEYEGMELPVRCAK